ncbi:MAG TPA: DUF2304 domain-containing protein [Acidimicrobiia bacterium]|nr:DUF2304 domain-containing protein [Acidimicrobiia bacterium]
MNGQIELLAIAISLGYLLFIARLVRRRQLREKYAMLWMAVGAAVVVVSLSRGTIDSAARKLGIQYGPTILFVVAIMFLMAVVAHLSYEVSRLEERTRKLAEELALLRPRKPVAGGDEPSGWDPGFITGATFDSTTVPSRTVEVDEPTLDAGR